MLRDFFGKMAGQTQSPPGVSWLEIFWSWVGGFLGISAVALLHYTYVERTGYLLIVGSFGASAVLLFGTPRSPLAQPRNFVGGHVISALIGVTVMKLLGPIPWLAAAVAVSLSIAAMHATKTLHPPGGATALLAVVGGSKIQSLGYSYVFMPVASGALIILVVALLINNLIPSRRYPEFWW